MKTHIIAIANHKGGVGKSTSTASIGAALAKLGKKTLLVDLDAQQNLSFMLTHIDEPEKSIYDSLVRDEALAIINISEGIDLVPASLELARAEIDLATKIAREGILKAHLDGVKSKYDYILLDCPPSLGIVTTNALVAADEIYIPLTAEALPMKGLRMLEDVVNEITRRVNPNLKLGGIFLTRFNNRRLNKDVVENIRVRYGEIIFENRIRECIALAEMPLLGQSIFEYAPRSNAATDYINLTREILARH